MSKISFLYDLTAQYNLDFMSFTRSLQWQKKILMFSHKKISKVNKPMHLFQFLLYNKNASDVSSLSFELVIDRHPGISASLPFPTAPGSVCCFKRRLQSWPR